MGKHHSATYGVSDVQFARSQILDRANRLRLTDHFSIADDPNQHRQIKADLSYTGTACRLGDERSHPCWSLPLATNPNVSCSPIAPRPSAPSPTSISCLPNFFRRRQTLKHARTSNQNNGNYNSNFFCAQKRPTGPAITVERRVTSRMTAGKQVPTRCPSAFASNGKTARMEITHQGQSTAYKLPWRQGKGQRLRSRPRQGYFRSSLNPRCVPGRHERLR
ncbi:hypothetical protein B0T11DRAFT_92 [Plectosphaerella cucumerina]|uniref:Uncharacterized protein n=1 Tax=Plectosphaerella cucumerina TaxID=40658 RepID=A0A8K0TQG9_9PEZI|nr:hypothetical protein B0T11DRAFT_92 [Plectosphaerella cucumerina]